MKDVRNRKKHKVAEISDDHKEIVIVKDNCVTSIKANADGTLLVVNI